MKLRKNTTRTEKITPHLVLMNRETGGLPLFIVPGSGGTIPIYKLFGKIFDGLCTVYGLEMMGTRKGEMPLQSIPEIAAQNIRWIHQIQPRGPYRFIGHSFGAYVMYEMARQLEEAGEALDFIAVLDQGLRYIPGIPPNVTKTDFALTLARDYFEGFKIIKPPYPDWVFRLRADLEQLESGRIEDMVPYIARFVKERLPHKSRSIAYFSRLVNIRFCNGNIVYFPYGRINTEVIVFIAKKNNSWVDLDETLGWSACCDNVKSFLVPGNHMNMIWGKNIADVARHLRPKIEPLQAYFPGTVIHSSLYPAADAMPGLQ